MRGFYSPGRVARSRMSRLPRPGRLLRTAASRSPAAAWAAPPDGRPLQSRLSRDSRTSLSWSACRTRRAGTALRTAPIDVHVAGTPCCLAACSQWASREREMHTSHIGTTSIVLLAAYVDHDDQPAAGRLPGRTGTGLSLRQDALDPGFHCVPTGPAHPDRDAGGAGVT